MHASELIGKLYHFKQLALHRARVAFTRTLILQGCQGGLGDTLFLSHLPRVAKATGCRRVLVSNRSVYRDPAYRTLVWESNPYVDGFTDERGLDIAVVPTVRPGCNLLDEIMLHAGFDDRHRQHEPEIYQTFEPVAEWQDLVVYDPNYITMAGDLSVQKLREFFEQEGVMPDAQLTPRNRSILLPDVARRVRTTDILDFCRLIVSCKSLYCLTTGTATLAAALGKPCTVLWGGSGTARAPFADAPIREALRAVGSKLLTADSDKSNYLRLMPGY